MLLFQVLTAYARECERAGVRIPRWRDATGCKHVVPFKYSGEHFGSSEQSASSHVNATANEVLNHGELDGGEVFDDLEDNTVLDLGGIGEIQPAYRAPTPPPPPPPPSRKPRRQGESDAKKRKRRQRRQRRLERKREKERKRRDKERRRLEEGRGSRTRELLGSMNGLTLKRVSVEGREGKKKLRWKQDSNKESFRPPFELFLRSDDEQEEQEEDKQDLEPSTGPRDNNNKNKPEQESGRLQLRLHNIDYSELPNSKGRTPIPLRDASKGTPRDTSSKQQPVHTRNWKRRRSIIN